MNKENVKSEGKDEITREDFRQKISVIISSNTSGNEKRDAIMQLYDYILTTPAPSEDDEALAKEYSGKIKDTGMLLKRVIIANAFKAGRASKNHLESSLIKAMQQVNDLQLENIRLKESNNFKFCPGCGIDWEVDEGFDQFGCSVCGFVKAATVSNGDEASSGGYEKLVELKKWIEEQKLVSQNGYIKSEDEEISAMYSSENAALGIVVMKIDELLNAPSSIQEGEKRIFTLKQALEIYKSGMQQAIFTPGEANDKWELFQKNYFKNRFGISI